MSVDVGSIIARLILDRSQFSDELAAARAEAAGFPDVEVGLNSARFDAEWLRVMAQRSQLGGSTDAGVGLNTHAFTAAAGSIEAMKAALGRGVEIPVGWAVRPSGLAVPGHAAADSGSGIIPAIAAGGGGGSKRVDVFYHADPNRGAGGAGGGGAGIGALLATLGWGGGARLPFIGGLAGAGSLAAFAGLGIEHVLTTVLGLAGSAAGGAIGGGLLGLGSLGKAGVGMGSDAAVMSSTIADTKTLSTDYTALAQAVALYGKNSTQAQQATAQLNFDMASLGNTAGVKAEAGLAQASAALNLFWDQATSGARVQAVNVLDQVLQLGRDYIPLVAAAAQRNLGIINQDIKPMFAWLEGPQGVGIFKNLENEFAHELPTAIHAFTQGIELFLKTVNVASTYTGGFMKKLDAFLTKTNSPTGFAKWSVEIGKLIGDFHMWEALIMAVGRDIYDLFTNDAGTASGIVTSLTAMLDRLGVWERSTQGKASLHSIFEVHKQEVLALLALIPPLASSFGHIYMTVAPALTGSLVLVLKAIEPVLLALSKTPGGAWVLGLTLIGLKLGLLQAPLKALAGIVLGLALAPFKAALAWLLATTWGPAAAGIGRVALALKGAALSMLGFDTAADANPIGAIILACAALGAALYLLITHFKTVSAFLHGPWGTAISFAVAAIDPLIGVPMLVIGHWQMLLGFFKQAWSDIRQWSDDGWHFIDRDVIQPMSHAPAVLTGAFHVLGGFFASLWGGIEHTFGTAAASLLHGFQALANGVFTMVEGILSAASHLPFVGSSYAAALKATRDFQANMNATLSSLASQMAGWGASAGAALSAGVAAGITNNEVTAIASAEHLAGAVVKSMRAAAQVNSPSLLTMEIGKAFAEGLAVGMDGSHGMVRDSAGKLVGAAGLTVSRRGSGSGLVASITLNDHRQITLAPPPGMTEAALRKVVCDELDKQDKELVGTIKQLSGVSG